MTDEKKIKTVSMNADFDAEELESSLDDAIKFLQVKKKALEDSGFENIKMELNGGDADWCSEAYYSLRGDRLETDYEFQIRIDRRETDRKRREKNLKAEKEKQDKKDREDYIRLKKKFDKDNLQEIINA